MVLAALLVVGLGLLVGLSVLPVISTVSSGFDVPGIPLTDIVHLLPICFIGIIILGAVWVVGKRG